MDLLNTIKPIIVNIVDERTEHFIGIALRDDNSPIMDYTISIGAENQAYVGASPAFCGAVKYGANRVVFAHNHPIMVPYPSEADRLMSDKLFVAGKILEIEVLDFIIVCRMGKTKINFYSFAEKGYLSINKSLVREIFDIRG